MAAFRALHAGKAIVEQEVEQQNRLAENTNGCAPGTPAFP
ncbi:hypothetical protein FHX08_001054 [Rhizobium sp. BK529]|nr:hypothetical protein [Rhizobium sp. BK529]